MNQLFNLWKYNFHIINKIIRGKIALCCMLIIWAWLLRSRLLLMFVQSYRRSGGGGRWGGMKGWGLRSWGSRRWGCIWSTSSLQRPTTPITQQLRSAQQRPSTTSSTWRKQTQQKSWPKTTHTSNCSANCPRTNSPTNKSTSQPIQLTKNPNLPTLHNINTL